LDHRYRVEAHFAAATSRHAGAASSLHGHTYRIGVTTASDDPTLAVALNLLAAELDLRRLEDMMAGASTDLAGIAAYLLERLILAHQEIVEIEVTEDPGWRNTSVTLIRPLRSAIR
jgi:hypothetical protein